MKHFELKTLFARMLLMPLLALFFIITFVSCSDDWKKGGLVEFSLLEVDALLPHGAVVNVKIEASDKVNIISRGLCWNTTGEPNTNESIVVVGKGSGTFSAIASGMTFDQKYYVKAFAQTDSRIYYSEEFTITPSGTYETGSFTDPRNQKNYGWVRIFDQIWMTSNLNYYTATGSAPYADDPINAFEYGLLYTYNAALGACPSGWRLPDMDDWNNLISNLGGGAVAGGILKDTGTEYWISPNEGASNQSGFKALPGGMLGVSNDFRNLGFGGYFWSATEKNSLEASFVALYANKAIVSTSDTVKAISYSVRCIKIQ